MNRGAVGAFGRKEEEYDWLNDPFDEKKAARDREQARLSGGTKAALGCGCLLIVFVFIAILAFAFIQFVSIASA